ncbi:MAG: DUF1579 family protein [Planctomycetes bacterium]|nr:DUF1579 family protein [Planctomycetota bacterium]
MSSEAIGQESSAPPPEMKALERLLGTWEVESIGKIPEETRSTSTHRRELVLGGRFVEDKAFDDKGKPISTAMYTYDSNRKAYRYWFFFSEGVLESTGTWDESSQTFTFICKPGGGATGVITIRFSDETTFNWSVIFKDAGGKVGYHLEGKAVRKK